MNINMSSIMSKTKAFSESPEWKRRMKACLEKYEKEGRASTGAGDKLITEKMMWEAVSKFIHVMKTTAADYDLPESVMEHINGIESSGYITKLPNNEGYEIHLSFCLTTDTMPRTLSMDGGMGIRQPEMASCEAVLILISHMFGARKSERRSGSSNRPSWISTQAMVQSMA